MNKIWLNLILDAKKMSRKSELKIITWRKSRKLFLMEWNIIE